MPNNRNKLSQKKDIKGSLSHNPSMNLVDELSQLGSPVSGQLGSSASLSTSGSYVLVSGLTGMSNCSFSNFLTITNAANINNNGTFPIISVINTTSVIIENNLFVSPETNNGSLIWIERNSYSLEDDLNYIRTDRENIKGVNYYDPIPQYFRCTDQSTPVYANLNNISGHTTDSKSFIDNIRFYNLDVIAGDEFITLESIGNLKHADSVNITGVPVNDGYDANNDEATFVAILDDGYATELKVLSGPYENWRIYGRTRAGSSTSPDSIEVEFRAMPLDGYISQSVPYTWENGQSSVIGVIIGFRTCLSNLSETAFRKLLLSGILFGGSGTGTSSNIPTPTGVGQVLFAIEDNVFRPAMPVTSTEGWLVNNLGILIVNEV